MDLSAEALDRLSIEELRALHEEHHRIATVLWHAVAARVSRVQIDGPTWAELELALQEGADPETAAAFAALGGDRSRAVLFDGASPPSASAVEAAAAAMARCWSEEVVAQEVASTAIERGMSRQEAISATARGISRERVRKARRARSS